MSIFFQVYLSVSFQLICYSRVPFRGGGTVIRDNFVNWIINAKNFEKFSVFGGTGQSPLLIMFICESPNLETLIAFTVSELCL